MAEVKQEKSLSWINKSIFILYILICYNLIICSFAILKYAFSELYNVKYANTYKMRGKNC